MAFSFLFNLEVSTSGKLCRVLFGVTHQAQSHVGMQALQAMLVRQNSKTRGTTYHPLSHASVDLKNIISFKQGLYEVFFYHCNPFIPFSLD